MHAPTDLMVVLKFVCRGGYYPPAIYKNIIAFYTGSRGRLPLQVCTVFVVFGVGAIHESPAGDQWSPLQTLCGIIFLDCRDRASIFALQIDGPKNRTCTWQAASLLRKHCARPYRFGGSLIQCL